MNEYERSLIIRHMKQELSNEELLELFTTNIEENTEYFDEILNETCIEKNGNDLGLLCYIGFLFDLFEERHLHVLNKIIVEHWHYMHENIAGLLQYFKSSSSIDNLYQTIFTKFEYLKYNNSYVLARKCMWALGDIATDQAIEKLELIYNSGDKELKRYAIEQFRRDKIKDKFKSKVLGGVDDDEDDEE